MIGIKLFGGPSVTRADGDPIRLPTKRAEGLLAYLAARGGDAVSRDILADLFWPRSAEPQARASLRQELSVLRKALGPDLSHVLLTHNDRIALKADALDVDVDRLRTPPPLTPYHVIARLELYSAPFLDGFRLQSAPFTDWVQTTAQALEAEVVTMGHAALSQSTEAGAHDDAAALAQHLCRIRPSDETAHRALIIHHLRDGDIAQARRQLETCAAAMRSDLDLDVSDETRALLDAPGPDPGPTPLPRGTPQRRRVTVLSAAANLTIDDPEAFDDAAATFAQAVDSCVAARGGQVVQVFGDHVLAVFGYPTGHDRDVDAAILAGGDLLDGLDGPPDTCRIGVAQGWALATPDPAQGPGGVQMSGGVLRQAEAAGREGPAGSVSLDAEAARVAATAIQLTPDAGPAPADPAPGETQAVDHATAPSRKHPMIGRDSQLEHLVFLLHQAARGRGGAATILGAPGEGKSRLVQEAIDAGLARGFDVEVYEGHRTERNSAMAPVLGRILRGGDRHSAADRLDAWLGPELADAAPYFTSLLTPDPAASADLPPDAKPTALGAFAARARSPGRRGPKLLVFDDIQWFDPTTCAAISRLVDDIEDVPVLVLMASRPRGAPDVAGHPVARQIPLSPLAPQDAERVVRGVLGANPASAEAIAQVLDRAGGNPLILEEFAQALAAQDPPAGDAGVRVALPDRLMPLLLSRIDEVPGAIGLLQSAAVFGRRFQPHHLPRATSGALLAELERSGILFASPQNAETAYIFKHALISEAIYETIPHRDRPAMHEAAAEALLAEPRRIPYSEAAAHLRAAGHPARAADCFETSGDQAARVSANAEAVAEYRAALDMATRLPDTPDGLRRALVLNRKIAAQFIALHGIPRPDVAPYYAEARHLSTLLDDNEEIVNATWGLWSLHLMGADLDRCLTICTDLTTRAARIPGTEARLIAAYMTGVTQAYRGALPQAATALETATTLYTVPLRETLQARFGMDIGLTAQSFLGWVHALSGDPARADAARTEALRLARDGGGRLGRVFAHVFAATTLLFLDRPEDARIHADRALTGANEMGYGQWSAQARIQLARVADLAGAADALRDLKKARADYLATGMVLARAYADVWIAEAQIRQGDAAAALDTLADLERYVDATGERYFWDAALSARAAARRARAPADRASLG